MFEMLERKQERVRSQRWRVEMSQRRQTELGGQHPRYGRSAGCSASPGSEQTLGACLSARSCVYGIEET